MKVSENNQPLLVAAPDLADLSIVKFIFMYFPRLLAVAFSHVHELKRFFISLTSRYSPTSGSEDSSSLLAGIFNLIIQLNEQFATWRNSLLLFVHVEKTSEFLVTSSNIYQRMIFDFRLI